jgi:hypothetical protein
LPEGHRFFVRLFGAKSLSNLQSNGKQFMCRLLVAFLSAGLLAIAGHPASAHHSMADYEFSSTTIEGTVQSFKYTNPHCILVLKTSGGEGGARVWHLEGDPPAMLDRAGVPSNVFQPGDRLRLQIQRLRSGKPGGFWTIRMVIMKNGHPFELTQCLRSTGGCESP